MMKADQPLSANAVRRRAPTETTGGAAARVSSVMAALSRREQRTDRETYQPAAFRAGLQLSPSGSEVTAS